MICLTSNFSLKKSDWTEPQQWCVELLRELRSFCHVLSLSMSVLDLYCGKDSFYFLIEIISNLIQVISKSFGEFGTSHQLIYFLASPPWCRGLLATLLRCLRLEGLLGIRRILRFPMTWNFFQVEGCIQRECDPYYESPFALLDGTWIPAVSVASWDDQTTGRPMILRSSFTGRVLLVGVVGGGFDEG